MMNKKSILALGFLVVVGLFWVFLKKENTGSFETPKSSSRQSKTLENLVSDTSISRNDNRQLPIVAKAELKEEYELDLNQEINFKKSNPYKLIARGKIAGKVKGEDGLTLVKASGESVIFRVNVSPNYKNFVTSLGWLGSSAKSGGDRVYDSQGNLVVELPKKPTVKQIKFGGWNWVSDIVLVGDSGDLIPHKHDSEKHGAEGTCEGCYAPLTSNTRLYTFNVKTKEMGEIALPKQLQGKQFTILRAVYDGTLEIADEEESYVGWFKINVEE